MTEAEEERAHLLRVIGHLLGLVASLRAEAHIARGSARKPVAETGGKG